MLPTVHYNMGGIPTNLRGQVQPFRAPFISSHLDSHANCKSSASCMRAATCCAIGRCLIRGSLESLLIHSGAYKC